MQTSADKFIDRWSNDPEPINDFDEAVRAIDNRCRIEGFLHTNRKRVIFSDGSRVVLANGCLSLA